MSTVRTSDNPGVPSAGPGAGPQGAPSASTGGSSTSATAGIAPAAIPHIPDTPAPTAAGNTSTPLSAFLTRVKVANERQAQRDRANSSQPTSPTVSQLGKSLSSRGGSPATVKSPLQNAPSALPPAAAHIPPSPATQSPVMAHQTTSTQAAAPVAPASTSIPVVVVLPPTAVFTSTQAAVGADAGAAPAPVRKTWAVAPATPSPAPSSEPSPALPPAAAATAATVTTSPTAASAEGTNTESSTVASSSGARTEPVPTTSHPAAANLAPAPTVPATSAPALSIPASAATLAPLQPIAVVGTTFDDPIVVDSPTSSSDTADLPEAIAAAAASTSTVPSATRGLPMNATQSAEDNLATSVAVQNIIRQWTAQAPTGINTSLPGASVQQQQQQQQQQAPAVMSRLRRKFILQQQQHPRRPGPLANMHLVQLLPAEWQPSNPPSAFILDDGAEVPIWPLLFDLLEKMPSNSAAECYQNLGNWELLLRHIAAIHVAQQVQPASLQPPVQPPRRQSMSVNQQNQQQLPPGIQRRATLPTPTASTSSHGQHSRQIAPRPDSAPHNSSSSTASGTAMSLRSPTLPVAEISLTEAYRQQYLADAVAREANRAEEHLAYMNQFLQTAANDIVGSERRESRQREQALHQHYHAEQRKADERIQLEAQKTLTQSTKAHQLQKMLHDTQQMLDSVRFELGRHQRIASETAVALRAAQQQAANNDHVHNQAAAEIKSLRVETSRQQNLVTDLTAVNARHEKTIKGLISVKSQQERQLETFNDTIKKVKEDARRTIEADFAAQRKSLEDDSAALKEKIKHNILKMKDLDDNAKAREAAAQATVDKAGLEVTVQKDIVAKLKKELDTVKTKLQASNSQVQAVDNELRQSRARVSTEQYRLAQLQKKVDSLDAQLLAATSARDQFKDSIVTLEKKVIDLDTAAAKKDLEIGYLTAEVDTKDAEIEKANLDHLHMDEAFKEIVINGVATVYKAIGQPVPAIPTGLPPMDKAKAVVELIHKAIRQVKSSTATNTTSTAQTNLATLLESKQRRVLELEEEVEGKDMDVKTAEKQLAVYEKQVTELVAGHKEQLHRVKADLTRDSLSKEAEWRKMFSEQKSLCETLRTTCATLETENSAFKAENGKLAAKVSAASFATPPLVEETQETSSPLVSKTASPVIKVAPTPTPAATITTGAPLTPVVSSRSSVVADSAAGSPSTPVDRKRRAQSPVQSSIARAEQRRRVDGETPTPVPASQGKKDKYSDAMYPGHRAWVGDHLGQLVGRDSHGWFCAMCMAVDGHPIKKAVDISVHYKKQHGFYLSDSATDQLEHIISRHDKMSKKWRHMQERPSGRKSEGRRSESRKSEGRRMTMA